jgi:deoxycytidylate deaminase
LSVGENPSSDDLAVQLEAGESGELIIGIVAPVGTDSKKVHAAVREVLREFGYETVLHKLSARFTDDRIVAAAKTSVTPAPDFDRLKTAMDVGDALRWGTRIREIVGIIAAGGIAEERDKRSPRVPGAPQKPTGSADEIVAGAEPALSTGDGSEQHVGDKSPAILDRVAHLVHSLKRPEEAIYLSRVYGGRFLLVSLYAPREERLRNLMHRGMSEPEAIQLIVRDECGHDPDIPKERWDYGQATRDTFHRADLFVDATRSDADVKEELRRFFDLVFGSPLVTPRKDEHAMFLAFAASLRSGDLSRQVGAVLATETGVVVAEGANDAPGPFGAPYWPDGKDHRDIAQGSDSNERIKLQMLSRLREETSLLGKSADNQANEDRLRVGGDGLDLEGDGAQAQKIIERVLDEPGLRRALKEAGFFDITEFGRAVHAEMAALTSCAARGVATSRLVLYCTTFPCHNCTKHLVAAGIQRVVFVEPYPKSRAIELHSDAISLTNERGKVEFRPFVGIGPKRYVELFALRDLAGDRIDRKDGTGKVVSWSRQGRHPVVSDRIISYIEREKVALVWMNVRVPPAVP